VPPQPQVAKVRMKSVVSLKTTNKVGML